MIINLEKIGVIIKSKQHDRIRIERRKKILLRGDLNHTFALRLIIIEENYRYRRNK
jgi:hypothetical protein